MTAALLNDHSVFLLFDFTATAEWTDAVLGLSPATLVSRPTIGLIHPTRGQDSSVQTELFTRGQMHLSSDLHPAAVAALRGAPMVTERSAPCLHLTDRGRAVLNGVWVRPADDPRKTPGYVAQQGLTFPLGKDAQTRLSADGTPAPTELLLSVVDLVLLTLSDRLGLAVLELHLDRRHATLPALEEMLHAITHAGRHQTLGWACETPRQHQFGIEMLVAALIRPAGGRLEPWNRIFAYSLAQLAVLPPEPEAEAAVWRLSHHFTSAYQHGPDFMRGTGLFRAFADVLHAASIEGVATIAATTSTFMATGLGDRIRTAYLPLVILAYHEHVELLDIAQHVSLPRRRHLTRFLDRFLAVRLRLRLPVVSDITAHNQFYDSLRHGLQIDALTRKIIEDAAEAERALANRAREVERQAQQRAAESLRWRERMFAPFLALFAGPLTFLTTVTVLKEVREAMPALFADRDRLPVIAAAVIAVLAMGLTWLRHRSANRPHVTAAEQEEVDEEMQEELATEATMAALEKVDGSR